jgi:hypothetical protein
MSFLNPPKIENTFKINIGCVRDRSLLNYKSYINFRGIQEWHKSSIFSITRINVADVQI